MMAHDTVRPGDTLSCQMAFSNPSKFKEVLSRMPHSQIGTQRGAVLKRLILTGLGTLKLSQVGDQTL